MFIRIAVILLVNFLMLVSPIHPAIAQSANSASEPKPKVGDYWVFRNSKAGKVKEQVVKVSGNVVTIKMSGARSEQITRKGQNYHMGKDYSCYFRWPLKVGKSWPCQFAGKTSNGKYVENSTVTVTGKERVKVPAGTFDTFVISISQKRKQGKFSMSGQAVYWYAPAAKTVVKSQNNRVWTGGKTKRFKWASKLLDYKLN